MIVTAYTPDRRTEVVELLNATLGSTTGRVRDEDYWKWKHEDNPFGKSIMLLAEKDNAIIGVRAVMKWTVMTSDGPIQIGKPVDTVTHTAFQRQGVFSTLTNEACAIARIDQLHWLINTPNRNSMPGYIKLGWNPLVNVQLIVRPVRPVRMLCRLAASAVLGEKTVTQKVNENGFIAVSDFLGMIKDSEVSRKRYPATNRTHGYFKWRYAEHPTVNYYALHSQDQSCGIIARVRNRRRMTELQVCEWIGDVSADWDGLFRQLESFRFVDYIVATKPRCNEFAQILKSAGFRNVRRKQIDVAGLRLSDSDGLKPEAMNWSLGDLEGL